VFKLKGVIMLNIKLNPGEPTPIKHKRGKSVTGFETIERKHTLRLLGFLRNPDGSKRKDKTNKLSFPITIFEN